MEQINPSDVTNEFRTKKVSMRVIPLLPGLEKSSLAAKLSLQTLSTANTVED